LLASAEEQPTELRLVNKFSWDVGFEMFVNDFMLFVFYF
jgi:hypothetical protein